MDTDKTQEPAEPSPASAGSQPDAWMVVPPTSKPMYATVNSSVAEGWKTWGHGHTVVALYRSPALTDEEREAIGDVIGELRLQDNPNDQWVAARLDGLLERLA